MGCCKVHYQSAKSASLREWKHRKLKARESELHKSVCPARFPSFSSPSLPCPNSAAARPVWAADGKKEPWSRSFGCHEPRCALCVQRRLGMDSLGIPFSPSLSLMFLVHLNVPSIIPSRAGMGPAFWSTAVKRWNGVFSPKSAASTIFVQTPCFLQSRSQTS